MSVRPTVLTENRPQHTAKQVLTIIFNSFILLDSTVVNNGKKTFLNVVKIQLYLAL